MLYPALEVRNADPDMALAAVLDAAPVAAETTGDAIFLYFTTPAHRDSAETALREALPGAHTTRHEIDDGDWARRSQEGLGPIVVGRVTVKPAVASAEPSTDLVITIQRSMGFGTGHHATTRLCLAALQELDLRGLDVLDVGTGSGILALAARALGARTARGVDCDRDAIHSARENLPLNPHLDAVCFDLMDLGTDTLPTASVVTANLTGALLCRAAMPLTDSLRPGGYLIVSGLLAAERDTVRDAFPSLNLVWEAREDEWVGMCLQTRIRATV